jgi:hypothetical protein
MDQFYTRSTAEAGVKFELVTPLGEKTSEYLMVLGIDSDAFKVSEIEAKRKAMDISSSEESSMEQRLEIERELVASLVTAWSFDEPCTPENVVKFFREAPQICAQVDKFAGNRAVYFAKKHKDLANGGKAK